MELNYEQMYRVVNVRLKQIDQVSLQNDKYNTEYAKLVQTRKILMELIKNEQN